MKHFKELLFTALGFILGVVLIIGCAGNKNRHEIGMVTLPAGGILGILTTR